MPDNEPLDVSKIPSNWLAWIWRLGPAGMVAVLIFLLWWNWPDISKRPGVQTAISAFNTPAVPKIQRVPGKKSILVSALAGDQMNQYQAIIVDSLSAVSSLSVSAYQRLITTETVTDAGEIERAHARAFKIVHDSPGLDGIFWGVVRTVDRTSLLQLYWTGAMEGDRQRLEKHKPTEMLELPTLVSDVRHRIEGFPSELTSDHRDALAAQLVPFVEELVEGPAPADMGAAALRVHFIDVGNGDAIWIQGPSANGSRKNIIIDGGPDSGKSNRLPAYLISNGLADGQIIDEVVLTHYHDDHYAGLFDVLNRFQVKRFVVPHTKPNGTKAAKLLELVGRKKVGPGKTELVDLDVQRDAVLNWGTGVSADILYADSWSGNLGAARLDENNMSVVIRMQYGKSSMLFMGDAQGKERSAPATESKLVEGYLLRKFGDGLRADILKSGHHGSESTATRPFLNAVHPEIVVLTAGRKAFGSNFLPDPSVVKRLTELPWHPQVLRTDEGDEGQGLTNATDQDHDDIFVDTDGKQIRAYQARVNPQGRQWQFLKTITLPAK